MSDTIKVTSVKSFQYRGQPEEWSNSYHFAGPNPADWVPVANALLNLEKLMFTEAVTFERAYCYQLDDDDSPRTVTEIAEWASTPGTFDLASIAVRSMPGDVAATVRWGTNEFTTGTRPKRIYLRKYFHGVYANAAGGDFDDELLDEQLAAMEVFADAMRDPDPIGAGAYCGPRGALTIGHQTSPWLTTRTLKRRGRRPPP